MQCQNDQLVVVRDWLSVCGQGTLLGCWGSVTLGLETRQALVTAQHESNRVVIAFAATPLANSAFQRYSWQCTRYVPISQAAAFLLCRVLIYEPVMEGRLVPADAADTGSAQSTNITADSYRPHKTAAAAAPAGPEDDATAGTGAKVVGNGVAPPSNSAVSGTTGSVTVVDCTQQSNAGTLKQRTPAINGKHLDAVSNSKASSHDGLTKKQRLLRRLAALQATFAFSGIWHLLIFYYATGLVTWHWFAFFSLQAPIMAAEAILIKYAKSRNFVLPRPLAIFLTNFLLIVVANPLFFGPCDWSGMCTAIWSNVKGSSVA